MLTSGNNSVKVFVNSATGFQWSNGKDDLDMYIDVEVTIADPATLLTSSDDVSYISREVFVQATTASDAEAPTYETFTELVGSAGITFTNYDSSVSRVDSSDSSTLNGL